MLFLFFSFIGIVLLIAIITWPFAGLFMILKGKKEFCCFSCGMLSQRYPPLSMGAGFRMRCGYCGQKTLIPSNSPTAQQGMGKSVTPPVTPMPICTRCGFRNVEGARFCGNCGAQVSAAAIPNLPVWTGALPPPVFLKPGISRAVWRFIGLGSAIAVGIFILLVIIGTLLPSAPNQSNASQPSAPQATPPQTSQATDSEATQTPEETEKDKQLKLGADAMVTAWQGTPIAFNERENLRFDAVVIMPDNTVCLWIHDANPTPGVEEPNALMTFGGKLVAVNYVTFDLWTRKCLNREGGVGVLPEILDRFNQIEPQMDDLNEQLHNSQQ
jgi:hypothetical protein